MKAFRDRVAHLWAMLGVAALAAGVSDAAFTLATEEPSQPDLTARVALGIAGLDAFLFLAGGLIPILLVAIAFPGIDDPPALVARGARALWPREPAARVRAGFAWLAAGVASAVFLVLTGIASLKAIESIRTTTFAAVAVTLLAFAAGAASLGLYRLLVSRLDTRLPASPSRGLALVSPAAVLGLAALVAAAALSVAADDVVAILDTLNLKPYAVFGISATAALLAGFVPTRHWPRPGRIAALALLPTLLGATFLATVLSVGEDNATRAMVTVQGQVSPLAYRGIKALLDLDDDGRLSFMGEGDCAPFDPTRYSGAPEIPNNGVDEDCDGEDLDLKFNAAGQKPRWDFQIPRDVRRPYNVVLLTIDAAAPEHMSLYGHPRKTTPFLEELASKSVWFPLAFSQGPSTRLALPAMFTSRYDSQIARAVAAKIPLEILPSNITMAEVMRSAGYRTIATLPTAYFRDWKGITQGFDVVNTEAIDDYVAPVFHNAPAVSAAALKALGPTPGRQPIFLWVHYYDPHSPYTRPPDGPDWGSAPEDIYDTELAYTDAEIRHFVGELDKVLPPKDTVLIVAGDHGEAFDEAHPNRHHGYDLHSKVLHNPLIVRAPFAQPAVVPMPTGGMDLLPSLVNLLGVPGTFLFEGTSFIPQLLGETADDRRMVFHQFYLPENVYHRKRTLQQVSVRTAQLYLIHDLGNNTMMLYRYRADPNETRNLLDEMPEAAAILKGELARWLARVGR